jgi:hypothetical protein
MLEILRSEEAADAECRAVVKETGGVLAPKLDLSEEAMIYRLLDAWQKNSKRKSG